MYDFITHYFLKKVGVSTVYPFLGKGIIDSSKFSIIEYTNFCGCCSIKFSGKISYKIVISKEKKAYENAKVTEKFVLEHEKNILKIIKC